MRGDDGLVIRSGFRRQSLVNRAMGLLFWVLIPSFVLGTGVYAIVEPGAEEAWDLILVFSFGAGWAAYAFVETRPVTVTLDARGVARTDVWIVRRIPFPGVARVCGVLEHGRLRVAVRSRAGSLLTLDDEFAEGDKARFLEAFARAVAPHGVAVETPPTMPFDLFGFVDADAIRRAGEHERRASAWAVLLLGFGFIFAMFGYVLLWAIRRGENFYLFFLPVTIVIFALMAVVVIARRNRFLPPAFLLFGVFIIFLVVYPLIAPPFWTGPGPQTLDWPMRAVLLLGGALCLGAGYGLLREVRKRRSGAGE